MTHFYVGNGTAYIPGVPMRDLTNAEWDELDEPVRKALRDAKIFTGRRPADQPPEEQSAARKAQDVEDEQPAAKRRSVRGFTKAEMSEDHLLSDGDNQPDAAPVADSKGGGS